jgi:hypothetical protein
LQSSVRFKPDWLVCRAGTGSAPQRTLWPCILQCAQKTWLRGRILAFDIVYRFLLSNGEHNILVQIVLGSLLAIMKITVAIYYL